MRVLRNEENELVASFKEKLLLLMPLQFSRFNGIHNLYADLVTGLEKIGIKSELIEIKMQDRAKSEFEPNFPVRRVGLDDIQDVLQSDVPKLTIDDFQLIWSFSHIPIKPRKLLIWAQYFYGHRFIFTQYRQWQDEKTLDGRIKNLMAGLTPSVIANSLAKRYISTLRGSHLVAQSLWTCLLLNRTYNLNCNGVVYLPVDPFYYNVAPEVTHNKNVLIYFGGPLDTNLDQLKHTTLILSEALPSVRFMGFGNQETAKTWSKTNNIEVDFYPSVSRAELSGLFARSMITVCPIYNGNFEKVPIESLLNGTPVISYEQPFKEVTGESTLIANIQNDSEVKRKIGIWSGNDIVNQKEEMKERILSIMDHQNVARGIIMAMNDHIIQ